MISFHLFVYNLPDARDHRKLLRLVLAAQLLPVPALLLLRPESHLAHRNRNEQSSAPVPVDDQDRDPSERLKSIVRASYKIETQTSRNAALCAARTAERAQRKVGRKVGKLAEDIERYGSVGQKRRGVVVRGDGSGRVGEVGNQHAGEEPVVGGVLEDVEEGHGCEREAVDEEGFELALDEVQHDHPEGEGLQG